MSNKEFITDLANRCGMKAAEAQRLMNVLLSLLGESFQEGDTVMVPNFGTFEVKKKMERIIANPGTGQRMLVPPKLTVAFKPTATVKERLRKGGDGNG